ncbi:CDP-glucose 4,6-dehydratase [Legionella santicrucis]|uniref:CDP-glucose 4,6-dehydratase n=1 Tax=Legionella santicrucis TaxID=45074 RepID=A0A0W0YLJ9_9GAMM|nr:CDP-glucose 4,6-dehydratase [Legionella santicrucis]KTD57770.1 CDP-glucose 4,6-dehydratase [Legionella santicrucis]
MGKQTSSMENLVMDLSFWKNKKVLITGHTGFKGSWLALWLQQLGAKVVGFSLDAPTSPNLFTLAHVSQNMVSLIGDIRDFNSLETVFTEHRPEIVFHMAAQSLVRRSYEDPRETYATNIMGTVNLFEAIRITKTTKAVVNVTSDKCYENKESLIGYREEDALGGYDPYSNSKACAELITSAFRNSYYKNTEYPCGLASARAGNVIGGGDWAKDRLIPDIVRSVLNESELIVRYPHALRPWQHVLEPLYGYLQLARLLFLLPNDYAQAWNFGPEEHDIKSVDWVIHKVKQLWDSKLCIQYASSPELHETSLLKLDSSKAKRSLNWKPVWNLENTLIKTVAWYRAYEKGEDMRKMTLRQIDEYHTDLLLPSKPNELHQQVLSLNTEIVG